MGLLRGSQLLFDGVGLGLGAARATGQLLLLLSLQVLSGRRARAAPHVKMPGLRRALLPMALSRPSVVGQKQEEKREERFVFLFFSSTTSLSRFCFHLAWRGNRRRRLASALPSQSSQNSLRSALSPLSSRCMRFFAQARIHNVLAAFSGGHRPVPGCRGQR